MKRKLFVFMAFLPAQLIFGQETISDTGSKVVALEPSIVSFDYYRQKLINESELELYKDRSFTFQVRNINTFKYDIFINGQPINHNTLVPSFGKGQNDSEGYLLNDTIDNITDHWVMETEDEEVMFTELQRAYVELKSAEDFCNALRKLVGTDISPQRMIELKKVYYNNFVNLPAKSEEDSCWNIINYYSKRTEFIRLYAPKLIGRNEKTLETGMVDTILAKANSMANSRKYVDLAVFYQRINEDNFVINRFIPSPNADNISITIKVKPKAIYAEDSYEVETMVPLKLKADDNIAFSTGVFVSNVADKWYVNRPVYENDALVGYNLTELNRNVSFGVAGYMHVYLRILKNVNSSVTVGIGIDQDKRIKGMLGPSVMLGKNNRLVVSSGVVLGARQDLSPYMDKTKLYNKLMKPIYHTQLRFGIFFGLSYNIF